MTQETYIPPEGEVRRAYASYMTLKGKVMEFDHWLAAHDADVRDKALSLTDSELAIAEGAYESSIMEYEDDGIEAMSIALDAVAEDRRSHEYRNG